LLVGLLLFAGTPAEALPLDEPFRLRLPRLAQVADDGGGLTPAEAPASPKRGPARPAGAEDEEPWTGRLDPDKPGPGGATLRLELSGRMVWLTASKLKEGPNRDVHTAHPRHDTDLPGIPQYGIRGLFDLKLADRWLLGGFYTHLFVHSERRATRKDLALDTGRVFKGEKGRTLIDVQLAELFLRYVVLDEHRLRLSFGLGAAYGSFRLRFDDAGYAEGRVQEYFLSINYTVQFKVAGPLNLYIESMFGFLAPHSLLSYVSEFRAGARIDLFPGMQLILAGTSMTGQVQEYLDVWGGKRTQGHRFRKASWSIQGLEIGVAYRY
jgi:hypothetical protein